ncbi:hypothetical protein niasHT_006361 [Heterodera trifolii]|uniref:Uncharacterized protein n=1 Tax=Heterodera trifolii TaxID=157864 RepID=A0ABD2LQC6_9BILA
MISELNFLILSSKLVKSEGLWLARGTFVLNLDIVVINRYFKLRLYNKEFVANIHCFIIRLNGTLFGGLSFPTGDKLAWEAINRIKMDAFKLVCELEWRTFNFSQMADSRVRNLHSYSWKTFVIAVASKRQNWPSSNAKL